MQLITAETPFLRKRQYVKKRVCSATMKFLIEFRIAQGAKVDLCLCNESFQNYANFCRHPVFKIVMCAGFRWEIAEWKFPKKSAFSIYSNKRAIIASIVDWYIRRGCWD